MIRVADGHLDSTAILLFIALICSEVLFAGVLALSSFSGSKKQTRSSGLPLLIS